MREDATQLLRQAAGCGLLLLGVSGLLLPFIPSIPFLLAGAAVLGHSHPLVRPWHARLVSWAPLGYMRARLFTNSTSASRKS
jgi:uncharacterized membrane protein YbaN (DUF454 family)